MWAQPIDIIAGNLSSQEISINYAGAGYAIAIGSALCWVDVTLHTDTNLLDNLLLSNLRQINHRGEGALIITDELLKPEDTEIPKISFLWHLHISFWTWVSYKDKITRDWEYKTISIDLIHSDIQKHYQEISDILPHLCYIFLNEDQYWFIKEKIPLGSLNTHITLLILGDSGNIKIISNWEENKVSLVMLDKIEIQSSIWAKDVFIWAFLWLRNSWFDISESVKLASLVSQKSMTNYGVDHLIKPQYRPKMMLIIWPSGAGKTTFINAITEEYERLNDLHPLKEVFLIDGSEEISKIDENTVLYFKDYLMKRKWWSNSIFSRFNGDGYDILEPEVWDEILLRLMRDIDPGKKYILEFSRWKDINHQQKKWYDLASTYDYFLELVYHELKKKNIESRDVITLFIDSDIESRLERNRVRKEQGLHYVSEWTIYRVYAESLCPIEWNISIIEPESGQDTAPVIYRINNSLKVDSVELNLFFLSEFDKAMKIFNISNILS